MRNIIATTACIIFVFFVATAQSAPTSIGIYQNGTWYLDANQSWDWNGTPTDILGVFGVGLTGAIPVVGDWNGDGKSEIGVYIDGVWYLDMNGNWQWDGEGVDVRGVFGVGITGAIPVVGEWNGDGKSKIGVYIDGIWYLDMNGNWQWDGEPTDVRGVFGVGLPNAIPVTGDWNGSGTTKIGIYFNGYWYLDTNANWQWDGTPTDTLGIFGIGLSNAIPVTGDWNGNGITKIGVYSEGNWYLDTNASWQWDGTPTDTYGLFGVGLSNAIPVTGNWLATTTVTQIIGSQGGKISVQNHLGDTITLEIPPLALSGTTSISITALDSPPANPIASNIFPGMKLKPSGLIFSTPIKIKVNFHGAVSNPDLAMLFWVKNSNFVLPIANQIATQNSIEGEIMHFSTVSGGVLSMGDIDMEISQIPNSAGNATDTIGIFDIIDATEGALQLAKMLDVIGDIQRSDVVFNNTVGNLEEHSLQILSAPLHDNPCGYYSEAIMYLKNLINILLSDTDLADQIGQRSCILSITPQNINLYPGNSQTLTAALFGPNGNQQSCSILNWYSSNLNVVDITATSNEICTIKAVSEGGINISANCDGLLGYTRVEVTDLFLKYNGISYPFFNASYFNYENEIFGTWINGGLDHYDDGICDSGDFSVMCEYFAGIGTAQCVVYCINGVQPVYTDPFNSITVTFTYYGPVGDRITGYFGGDLGAFSIIRGSDLTASSPERSAFNICISCPE